MQAQNVVLLQDLGKIGIIDIKGSGTANICGDKYNIKATKVEGEINICDDHRLAKLVNLNDMNNQYTDPVYFLI